MEIFFVDGELARSCNDDAIRERCFGTVVAPVLRRRLAEIASAAHLAELRCLPQVRLRGHADGRLLVALGPTADLHMRPHDDPPPMTDGRLVEWAVRSLLVTAVQLSPAA
ncbi:hypothetical protein [Streptomyces sp. NRRL S-350]|uniref:hypothetical protein n=1 Tax=Streptomyces sp. NRRL S-350 TaxID=1463902 RepID=UPI0004C20741|nr:hypothetical protein [Streptomyces sp. NRRL S-350]